MPGCYLSTALLTADKFRSEVRYEAERSQELVIFYRDITSYDRFI